MSNCESDSVAISLHKGALIGNITVGGQLAGRGTVVISLAAPSTPHVARLLEVVKHAQEQIGLSRAPAGPRVLRSDTDWVRKKLSIAAQIYGWHRSFPTGCAQALPDGDGLAMRIGALA
jgi:hypothetical protein